MIEIEKNFTAQDVKSVRKGKQMTSRVAACFNNLINRITNMFRLDGSSVYNVIQIITLFNSERCYI